MSDRSINTCSIDIKDAVVSYREDIALRGVSLKVNRGEFVGVFGPNGAGKTTLLTIVNGMGKLLNGQVRVLGQDLSSFNSNGLRKKVGYVAQAQNIDPRMPMSVREVVIIGRYGRLGLFRKPGKHRSNVDSALLVGLAHLSRRPIGHLSGGEQQRVAIARCLAQEPEIFLLDEPTASLDWKARSELLELVRHIHEERKLTTLFVTHDLDALPDTCSRIVLMKDGLIEADGVPEKLICIENLSYLYNIPPSMVEDRQFHKQMRES